MKIDTKKLIEARETQDFLKGAIAEEKVFKRYTKKHNGYYTTLRKTYFIYWSSCPYTLFLQLTVLAEKWQKPLKTIIQDFKNYKKLIARDKDHKIMKRLENNQIITESERLKMIEEIRGKHDPELRKLLASIEHHRQFKPPFKPDYDGHKDYDLKQREKLNVVADFKEKMEAKGTPKIQQFIIKDYFYMQKKLGYPYQTFSMEVLRDKKIPLADMAHIPGFTPYTPNQQTILQGFTKQSGGLAMLWHKYGELATLFFKEEDTGKYENPPKGLDDEQHIFIKAWRRFYSAIDTRNYQSKGLAIQVLTQLWLAFSKDKGWEKKWLNTLKQFPNEYKKQREKRKAGVYNMSGLIGYVPLVDFITYMLYISRTIIGYQIPTDPYEDAWVYYRKEYLDDLIDYQKALDKGEIYKDFDEYIYATHWRK